MARARQKKGECGFLDDDPMTDLPGFSYIPGYFDEAAQRRIAGEIERLTGEAPFFRPAMPRTGRPFSVEMTNFGPLGWVSDKEGGYRYQAFHPVTQGPWPAMPQFALELWQDVANCSQVPEACLVNWYEAGAKMGLHQDRDEQDFAAPVVSISLGDRARFRIGGLKRKDPTRSFLLHSGDVVVLGGEARLAFHGIDRIYPGTSSLLSRGGRINLTLRRVNG